MDKREIVQAIKRLEFRLYYQPILSLSHPRKLAGYEVLSRWHHPSEGILLPVDWIELIESDPYLAWEFDKYILKEAAINIRETPGLFHSVNTTPSTFVNPLWGSFLSVLDVYHFSEKVIIEVTERCSSQFEIEEAINSVICQGFNIALDDFGVGSNSLGLLAKLNKVSHLKIDRSFTDGILESQPKQAIARSIVFLCRQLKILVIAEGIETGEQADFLWAIGCDYGQGYYFGKPQILF